ncbi:hypothetical protein CI088_01480 [Enterococcus plantarum]|uniref:Uncharacterized protein n=1 Tax=Enterococcus plantarum TaxID=1077675 RepID=A0A2W4BVP8_9ENTE|nr:hypothetical protein [Enterococcus plantarum]PZL77499.1 hypothetical protein CI088_01480 [Enterococcus plantarum]
MRLEHCWYCGNGYYQNRSDQIYCSKKCRLAQYAEVRRCTREDETQSKYIIQMTNEFGEISIFSSTYRWGGEMKAMEAVEGVSFPKIYTSEKRASQGLKSLEDKLAAWYSMEVIPYNNILKKDQKG